MLVVHVGQLGVATFGDHPDAKRITALHVARDALAAVEDAGQPDRGGRVEEVVARDHVGSKKTRPETGFIAASGLARTLAGQDRDAVVAVAGGAILGAKRMREDWRSHLRSNASICSGSELDREIAVVAPGH